MRGSGVHQESVEATGSPPQGQPARGWTCVGYGRVSKVGRGETAEMIIQQAPKGQETGTGSWTMCHAEFCGVYIICIGRLPFVKFQATAGT